MRRDCGTLAPTVAVAPPVRRDYGAPGLRYTGAHDCRGVYGAPGLRYTGAHDCRGVYGAPGLRCTATTVHWRPRLPCACGAPGFRCAGTTVRRGQQFHRRGPAAPLLPPTAWNNERRRPPWYSDRSLDPSRLGAERPPPESSILGVLDLSGSTPAYLGPAMREAAQLPTASHRMALGAGRAGTLLLTGPPSRVASAPRRLSARCVLEHSLVT